MAVEKALAIAKEQDLDLVLVAPNVNPPVCKILDYGKHLYKQKKIDRKHRASQKKSEVKGIRLSLRTGVHDIEVKLKRARGFLEERHSLKIQLIFKGREVAHRDLATEKMLAFAEQLKDLAVVDNPPKKQGHTLFMTLSPLK
jgi:translation initiation factor IF-3